MAHKYAILAFVVVICTLFKEGEALKCFNCTSVLDSKCGKTWGYSGTEGDKYLVKCEGNTVACRKLETTDTYKGMTVVLRSCWNVSSVETLDEDFLDCTKMASIGKACYCNKDLDNGKPCNGRQPLLAFVELIVSALLAAVCVIF
ncbi:uncharacterized protein LOC123559525 [Mercenaria mercenaria]|uniref:uncharacterized protein LOC123559525 n=1 Tax=Mercenaria mercenaria TaxID=6596 RepID=UPI001E1D561C|nr:uncharacterized protein LOC123559525 [Mercenaria mercenaria]